jgi:PAP2 superfamily protein
MRNLFFIFLFSFGFCAAQQKTKAEITYEPTVQQQVWSLTEVMYHDVVNPPAAARFYSYAMLTGYEIISQLDPSVSRFQTGLNQYPTLQFSFDASKINNELAALYGILETGRNIIPSGYLLEDKQKLLKQAFQRKKINAAIIDSSIAFAQLMSKQIVQYCKTDGYFKLSTLARYKPFETDSNWKPTPPEYMAAVEPHWQTIRTFFLESSKQFRAIPPIRFDTTRSSDFFKLANEVYTTVNDLTAEQKEIANFWDCNPFAVQFQGHMSIGLKKISPGGHWMGITGIACSKANLDFNQTLLLHTLVALTLNDAFISCWNEKYSCNRIRPETVINRYIDERWKPLLQTPPFPEYSSGHSVISTAAAEVLSHFLGDHFSFNDNTESYIGLQPRNFSSFRDAAAEARISRLYGGIHFRDAIENGGEQGREIGEFILKKLNLHSFRTPSGRF